MTICKFFPCISFQHSQSFSDLCVCVCATTLSSLFSSVFVLGFCSVQFVVCAFTCMHVLYYISLVHRFSSAPLFSHLPVSRTLFFPFSTRISIRVLFPFHLCYSLESFPCLCVVIVYGEIFIDEFLVIVIIITIIINVKVCWLWNGY